MRCAAVEIAAWREYISCPVGHSAQAHSKLLVFLAAVVGWFIVTAVFLFQKLTNVGGSRFIAKKMQNDLA